MERCRTVSGSNIALNDVKVFGIGLPMTGTTSLEAVLRDLGYDCLGYDRAAIQTFLEEGFSTRVREYIDRHDAFSDWPWCLAYRELLFAYGSTSKFVLTKRRTVDAWLSSVLRSSMYANTTEMRRRVYGIDMPHGYEAFLRHHYERHIERVTAFFAEHDASHLLLIIDVSVPDDHAKLLSFLDKEPSGERAFPHLDDIGKRKVNLRTLYRNLELLNATRPGLDRPLLTVSEAMQDVVPPEARRACGSTYLIAYPRLGFEFIEEEKRLERLDRKREEAEAKADRIIEGIATVPGLPGRKTLAKRAKAVLHAHIVSHYGPRRTRISSVKCLERHMDVVMSEVETKRLFGIDLEPPNDRVSGYSRLGNKVKPILAQAISRYARNGGIMPNILFPQTFSEFNILSKAFMPFPVGVMEDKLANLSLVPERVQHLFEEPARPFVTSTPATPDNEAIPPGRYFWKANFGYRHYMEVEFPAPESVFSEMKRKAQEWFSAHSNLRTGQWWTSDVPRRVFLEQAIESEGAEANDWKFWVLGGRVAMLQIDSNRHGEHRQTVYDRDYTLLPFEIFEPAGPDVPKPARYDDMVAVAEAIGSQFDFVRVDLYCEHEVIYLGELTFVPAAAAKPFRDRRLETWLGERWPAASIVKRGFDWYNKDTLNAARPAKQASEQGA